MDKPTANAYDIDNTAYHQELNTLNLLYLSEAGMLEKENQYRADLLKEFIMNLMSLAYAKGFKDGKLVKGAQNELRQA